MTVTVRRLSRDMKKQYRMDLIAGKEGLDNIVKWVHAIEDYDVARFLRGNELILTTGIGNLKDEGKLLNFVTKLQENKVSGIMINTGPYIHDVPRIVVDYCNQAKLPLFTIPWEVRLVDLTRQYCQIIIESEEKEKSLTSLVKEYLFDPRDREKLSHELTRNGFTQHLNYCVINIGIDDESSGGFDQNKKELLREIINREVNKITDKYVIFKNESNFVLITAGLKRALLQELIHNLSLRHIDGQSQLLISVSSNKENLMLLPKSFEISEKLFNLCKSLDKNIIYYDDMGIYKILLSVSEKSVMKDYEKQILGPIIEHEFLEFVTIFIKNNGNIHNIARSMNVHRNTIHYKMNKVKEVAKLDLSDMEDLLKVKLCLLIRNIK